MEQNPASSPLCPIVAACLIGALGPATGSAQAPTAAYSHGDPTGAEQQTLLLINRARRDPVAESYRLVEGANFVILGNYYGVTRDAFLGEFRGLAGNGHGPIEYRPQQALAFNPILQDAVHRQNSEQTSALLARQYFDSRSGDGLTSIDYAFQAGYLGGDGENLAYIDVETGVSAVKANQNGLLFELDNRNKSLPLGHRFNLLGVYNGGRSRGYGNVEDVEIGIAIAHVPDPYYGGDLEARVDCIGAPSQNDQNVSYITGVVFQDTDFDGHYTPGEGLGGVLVQPDHGYWSAYTSASGGYAIPLCPIADAPRNTAPGAGLQAGDTVTLTFSGGPLRVPITRTVVLPGHSVEVNVAQPQEAGFPGAKRPALAAVFTPETHLVTKVKFDGSLKTTVQGALRLTNLGKKNTGTFRVVLLLAAAGSDGTDLTGATPLAEMDVANVGKNGVLDLPLAYKVKDASGRVVVALVDVLEKVPQTERDALRPMVKLP